MKKKKTNGKRGGQPGNRNAVKHGAFASAKRKNDKREAEFCRMARQAMRLIG